MLTNNKISLFVIFIISNSFFSHFLVAQNDNYGTVDVTITNQKKEQIEVLVSLQLPERFFIYDEKSKIDGIDGISFDFDDVKVLNRKLENEQSAYKKVKDVLFEKENVQVVKAGSSWLLTLQKTNKDVSFLRGKVTYNISDGKGFYSEEIAVNVLINEEVVSKVELRRKAIDVKNPLSAFEDESNKSSMENDEETNLLHIFLLGFLGGLLALLTPCVFPMIPLTVSFFTKQSETKQQGISNAVIYGLSIILIYGILSIPFHFLDSINPEILNTISTNSILNVIFFIIFIAFAFSFFGYYELSLPSKWMSKVDKNSSVGSITGIFFMGLTLALVSFSCTGPILGSLLVGSITYGGGAIQLTFGMLGFGLALALPFALLAMFPNWLKNLPKSGGWLGVVKVVFGFLELALAFKFLSNADLVEHWGILKREIFLGIWILVGVLFSLYILGVIRFPHQTTFKTFGWFRALSFIIVAGATVYLALGLTTKKFENLSLVSGFPPPMFYSIFEKKSNCALNLSCEKDYFKGLERATKEKKPILLDFTGWACVNCRKMEENIWIDDDIYKLLNEHFILVSLYVDDRKKLPIKEQFEFVSDNGSKTWIETVGDKWSKFETVNFKNNSQPLYAILSLDEKLLVPVVAYTPDAKKYQRWLEQGLDVYHKRYEKK